MQAVSDQIGTSSLICHSYLCSLLEYFSRKAVISTYGTQNGKGKFSISMYRESDNQMGASCQISTDNCASISSQLANSFVNLLATVYANRHSV